ncbi:hypothetical protein [Shewanella sp. WPAGA9]|uniref:hypothetical protein n=1 Tax=Shewanella sp. ENK2 TaxID=2775245 RepID=UPI0017865884|nr:hypothetical protein [Shewanella sp. WPAGA9]
MSKHDNNDSEPMTDEAFAALQQDISALYKLQNLERPSAAIDAAILAQSKMRSTQATQHDSNSNVIKVSFWHKHKLPLSSAASVMIIASVMLLNPEFNQHAVTDIEEAIPMATEVNQTSPSPAMMRAEPNTFADEPASSSQRVELGSEQNIETMAQAQQETEAIQALTQQQAAPKVSTEHASDIARSQMKQSEAQGISKIDKMQSQPLMQHDSVEQALETLTQLVKDKDWQQAERYLQTIEQRFPRIVELEHPQHEVYQQLKRQLTTQ